MQIRELADKTGVPAKTIRYYESIGILPPPKRQPNGYRIYDESDVTRLQLVVGARYLEFSLHDIAEILAMRDSGEAPCRFVLDLLEQKACQVAQRIEALRQLEMELWQLHELGQTFPLDDVDGKNCVCHLVRSRATHRAYSANEVGEPLP